MTDTHTHTHTHTHIYGLNSWFTLAPTINMFFGFKFSDFGNSCWEKKMEKIVEIQEKYK
jgi:hypothetical protein